MVAVPMTTGNWTRETSGGAVVRRPWRRRRDERRPKREVVGGRAEARAYGCAERDGADGAEGSRRLGDWADD